MELFNELELLTDSKLAGLLEYADTLKSTPYRTVVVDLDFQRKPRISLKRVPTTRWGYRVHAKHCIENKCVFLMGERLVIANRDDVVLSGNRELGCYIHQLVMFGELTTVYFEIVDRDLTIVMPRPSFCSPIVDFLKNRIQLLILPDLKRLYEIVTVRYTYDYAELRQQRMSGELSEINQSQPTPYNINLRGHSLNTRELMATSPEKLRTLDDFAVLLTKAYSGAARFYKEPISEDINAAIITYLEPYHDIYFEIEDLFPDNNTLIATLTENGLDVNCVHLVRVRRNIDSHAFEVEVFNTDYPYQRTPYTTNVRKNSVEAQKTCKSWKRLGVSEGFALELLRLEYARSTEEPYEFILK